MFRMRRRLTGSRIILIGGITVASLVAIVGITTFTASGAASPTRVPQGLTNPNLPYPTNAILEPTTAARLHKDATARVQAATSFARNPPTKDPNTPTPIPTADHPISRVGIISGSLPPPDDFPFRNDATIENFYRTFPDNFMFIVAAGVAKDDPQQGFVGVATYRQTGLMPLNKSLTPTKHGSVHITAVNGSLVTLVATDGTAFTFDYNTYTFK